jgi:integrase
MVKSIQELFAEYLLECEFSRKSKPETLRGYRQTFAIFMKLMPEVSLHTLSSSTMTRFFKALDERKRVVGKGIIKSGIKKSTVATYWSKLYNFFEWLRIRKHIAINPFSEMKYPRPVYEDRRFLKKQEIEKILTSIHAHSTSLFLLKRNLAILYLLLFCGLRREELLLLQLRDIDLERKLLTVRAETSKIPRTRSLPMHSQLMLHIKDYLKERNSYKTPYLIVSTRRDDRLSTEALKNLVMKLNRLSGVKFHLHRFRHTFAVNFLKASNNIVKLKQLMGHTDIRMTMVYLRCLPTAEMRSDIEQMSIDDLI